jgi:hypothetical protein
MQSIEPPNSYPASYQPCTMSHVHTETHLKHKSLYSNGYPPRSPICSIPLPHRSIKFTMLSILLSVSPVPTYLLLIPIFYISYNVLLISLDPLRDIPGLLLARFTRFWYLYASWRGDFERTNINLHRRYGPIVRIAPGEYSIDDVEAVRKIFALGSGFAKVWYLYSITQR